MMLLCLMPPCRYVMFSPLYADVIVSGVPSLRRCLLSAFRYLLRPDIVDYAAIYRLRHDTEFTPPRRGMRYVTRQRCAPEARTLVIAYLRCAMQARLSSAAAAAPRVARAFDADVL